MCSNAYYLLCGLGVGTLNLWRFVEARASSGNEPSWNFLYSFATGGNTAMVAEFITSRSSTGGGGEEDASASGSSLTIAATCNDRNLRVWELEHTSTELQSDGNDTGDDEESEDPFRGYMHTIKSHHDIPNTKGIAAIYGEYAYIIEPTGEMYRILIREPGVRHQFELEKLDNGSGNTSKSRRSMILLESVYASDDGNVLIAVSTEGIFYYSNSVGSDPESGASFLRIIGRNASLNPQYKTPMKVYTPRVLNSQSPRNANAKPLEPMMAVVTNPQSEDEGEDGYFNVDPTEGFASRWMVPSRGRDCWVCGVRNVSHWQAPTEQQQQKTAQKQHETNERKQWDQKPTKSSSSGEKRQSIDAPSPRVKNGSESAKAKAKAAKSAITTSSSSSSASNSNQVTSKPGALFFAQSGAAASSPSVSHGKPPSGSSRSNKKARQRLDTDEDEVDSGGGQSHSSSGGASASSGDIAQELERYKERYDKIVMEWQRRLKGERQMRRLWKTRETEFNSELDDALEKLYAAEQELVALKTQHKDAEKRYIFEKLKAEQQSSVKVRYEQLCEQMTEKLALVDDQKRVMEQTTRTLLQEVDRNVRSLKTSALLERNECVVCKDKEANTAIIPCGHLVFCEEDGEVYRRNSPANAVVCPVCQRELISLLRIY